MICNQRFKQLVANLSEGGVSQASHDPDFVLA